MTAIGALLTLTSFVKVAGTLRVVWHSSRYPTPEVRAFVDFMAVELNLNAKRIAEADVSALVGSGLLSAHSVVISSWTGDPAVNLGL